MLNRLKSNSSSLSCMLYGNWLCESKLTFNFCQRPYLEYLDRGKNIICLIFHLSKDISRFTPLMDMDVQACNLNAKYKGMKSQDRSVAYSAFL